jgi:hypothetical protein
MISIAAGNETMTTQAHARSLSPDVIVSLPEPAIECASAAPTVMSTKKTAPSAALEAVAAAPAALAGITQGARDRSGESEQEQDCSAEENAGNQDPRTIVVVKGDELVGLSRAARLINGGLL